MYIHNEMKKNKIFNSISQILLIIASVLIAFAVDRWYENSKERKSKEEFIAAQIEDFQKDAKELEYYVDFNSELIAKAQSALLNKTNVDSIVTLTMELPYLTNFKPNFSNLRDLRDVYDVDKYLSPTLKKGFIEVYSYYSDVKFYEENYHKLINNQYQLFWRKNFNNHNKTFPNKEIFRSDEYLNLIDTALKQLNAKNDMYTGTVAKIKDLTSSLGELK